MNTLYLYLHARTLLVPEHIVWLDRFLSRLDFTLCYPYQKPFQTDIIHVLNIFVCTKF
jgi:hypothetical protein